MSHLFPIYNYATYSKNDEFEKVDRLPVVKSSSRVTIGEYFPIRFDEITRSRIYRYLESKYSIQDILLRAKDLSMDERNHVLHLLLSIEAYYQQKIYVMSRRELLPLLMTEKGLKYLKRLKIKSFLESNDGHFCERPDWFDEVDHYNIYDIGEIFNYNYGMFWEAEDTQDYLLSKEPLSIDNDILKIFKRVTNRIISNSLDFEEVRPIEILLRVSNSKCLDSGKSIPHYLSKSKHLFFSSKRKEGRRVLITTGPGQGRDAIINNVEDLNTIQLINENIRNFLKVNFRNFLLLGTSEENKRKFFRRCMKHSSYFCRDIKKEGLTKPKYLCNIILKALNARFPRVFAFSFPDFYSGPWFEGDKGERGHGLGMANELTTLLQILIFFTVNEFLGEEGEYITSNSAFYLNDDAIVFLDGDQDNLDTYINADFSVCEGLGILGQRDKSFFSQQCAIFCETYFSRGKPFVNDKESYILRESNIMSKCSNILEAKFYAGNMKGSLSDIENLLKKTYIYLGYEFSKDEINWPITLGGLRPFKLRGTDFTLNYVLEYQELGLLWRSWIANKERRLWQWNKFLKEYIPPIVSLFPQVISEKEERILDKLTISSDYNLSSLFFRPTKEHKFFSSVEKLYKKRQEIFKSITSSPTAEIFCKCYSTESSSNVYLPDSCIERWIDVKLFQNKNFKDPYLVTNPVLAYLNKFEKVDKNVPNTSWGLFQQTHVVTAEKSVFARSRTMNTLSLIDRFEEDIDISILVFPENEDDISDFMESYPKPFFTYELVKFGNKLPIPKKDFRNPDLITRKEVFSKYLNFRELTLSQTRTWLMMKFILEFEKAFKSFYEFEDDFWDVVDSKVPKIGETPSQSSESSDSDDYNPPGEPIRLDHDVEIIYPEPPPKEETPVVSEESVEEVVLNQFLKESQLPEGDLSVYGSEEWIRWFVNQDDYILDEYCGADKNLADASVDVIAFRRQFVVSDLFFEHNSMLKQNVIASAEFSWIAHFYVEELFNKKTEEDDPLEIDIF